jgi:hypothetical protein
MAQTKRSKWKVLTHSVNEDGIPCLAVVEVAAQYHRVVDGVLIFRNFVPNGYPEMVQTFAAGHWLEVKGA